MAGEVRHIAKLPIIQPRPSRKTHVDGSLLMTDSRLWVDGCFDFFHHGHAGALQQARKLGSELYCGVHSDEEIAKNKGPVVMHMNERILAVESCKWATKAIGDVPYVTDPKVMDSYGCKYVVHGDDITTDANGYDCYQEVKDLGRFLVVKRTPNISTTDLIGRMLSSSTAHLIKPATQANNTHFLLQKPQLDRFEMYATGCDAKDPHSGVYILLDGSTMKRLVSPSRTVAEKLATNTFYVDGSFDLFHPGHMLFLKEVWEEAQAANAAVCVGMHDDSTVNQAKGQNYPIMNMFERALCVLQCRYVDALVLAAPFHPSTTLNTILSIGDIKVTKVFHGPTPIITNRGASEDETDPYADAKKDGMFEEADTDSFQHMTTDTIVNRVLTHRRLYEERQRKKGVKSETETTLRRSELQQERRK